MPEPLDAVRAEGRRLLAEVRQGTWLKPRGRFIDWMWDHADVLLADPAPEGLSQDQEALGKAVGYLIEAKSWTDSGGDCAACIGDALTILATIIDRLSTPTEAATDG